MPSVHLERWAIPAKASDLMYCLHLRSATRQLGLQKLDSHTSHLNFRHAQTTIVLPIRSVTVAIEEHGSILEAIHSFETNIRKVKQAIISKQS